MIRRESGHEHDPALLLHLKESRLREVLAAIVENERRLGGLKPGDDATEIAFETMELHDEARDLTQEIEDMRASGIGQGSQALFN